MVIFQFDIDKCIIGNISICIDERKIVELLHKKCKIKSITNVCNSKIDIVDELNSGILRPNFKKFVDFIKKNILMLNCMFIPILVIDGLIMH